MQDKYLLELQDSFFEIFTRYKDKYTKRSKINYVNHIVEGLMCLNIMGVIDPKTYSIFCLHPTIHDEDFLWNDSILKKLNYDTLMGLIEYRSLSLIVFSRTYMGGPLTKKSPLEYVNQCLIADKIQNRKDFELYHKGIHPKSEELEQFFEKCLDFFEQDYYTIHNKLVLRLNNYNLIVSDLLEYMYKQGSFLLEVEGNLYTFCYKGYSILLDMNIKSELYKLLFEFALIFICLIDNTTYEELINNIKEVVKDIHNEFI